MSTEVAKKSGSGYAWLVMVGFGMVMCATIGAITVMGGLFYYPGCARSWASICHRSPCT